MYVIMCAPVRTVKDVWESGRALYIRAGSTCECVCVTRYDTSQRSGVHAKGGARPLQLHTLCIQPQPRTGIPTLARNLRACGRPDWGYSLARDFAPMSGIWSIVKLGLICFCSPPFPQRKASAVSSSTLTFCKLNWEPGFKISLTRDTFRIDNLWIYIYNGRYHVSCQSER